MAEKEQDDRFSKVFSDPRFRTLRKADKTLKIDNRFKSMFTEDKFKLKYSMDKRGKSKKHLISEDYKKFYSLSDEESSDKDKDGDNEKVGDFDEENDDKLETQKSETGDDQTLKQNLTHKYGYHRGMKYTSDEESSSSSSSESEDSGDEDEEIDHQWGELDKNAQPIKDATSRIAICNADWDRINAQDMYVLLNSFKRATGAIRYVRIYYSKFGEERLKVEDKKGPSKFIFGNANTIENSDKFDNISNDGIDESDNEEEEDFVNDQEINDDDGELEKVESSYEHESVDEENEEGEVKNTEAIEKLRKYQLERLKYFYAVVECDSTETSEVIYSELDGMEYESSSTTLDIRFIPDEMDFDDVKLKEECTSMPNSSNYNPPAFINTALQQSNVKLTWDETDPKRKNVFDKAFDKDNEDDLKAYLASSDDEEDAFEQDYIDPGQISTDMKDDEKINKYKDLLKSLDTNKDGDYEMEVTWDPSLKSTTENLVSKKDLDRNTKDKQKINLNGSTVHSDDSNVGDIQNDLISDSEEEQLQVKYKSKDKFKKWKKKRSNQEETTSDNLNEDPSNLELLMVDIEKDGQNKKHFNYKEIVDSYSKKGHKTKGTTQNEKKDSFKFNSEDPRFNAIYTSHLYNVDQSDPNFKKTEAFDQILNKRKDKAQQLIKDEGKSIVQKKEISKPQNKSWMTLVRKVQDTSGEQIEKRQINNKPTQEQRFNINKKFRR